MAENICPECGNALEKNTCPVCGFCEKETEKEELAESPETEE